MNSDIYVTHGIVSVIVRDRTYYNLIDGEEKWGSWKVNINDNSIEERPRHKDIKTGSQTIRFSFWESRPKADTE